jgi:hypothetical protein
MIPKLTARPIPVPALPLVVKERIEKTLLNFRRHAVPVSVMQTTTRSRFSCVVTRTSPPEGMASTAL